jgi:hypothetical protein
MAVAGEASGRINSTLVFPVIGPGSRRSKSHHIKIAPHQNRATSKSHHIKIAPHQNRATKMGDRHCFQYRSPAFVDVYVKNIWLSFTVLHWDLSFAKGLP